MPAKASPKRCRICSPWWCRLTAAASQPRAASCARVWPRIGTPTTGSSGFGTSSVSGRRRVPSPAASTRALTRLPCMHHRSGPQKTGLLPEHHLGRRVRMVFHIVLVEAQVGPPLRLVGIEAAALGDDLRLVPLELGEVADRRVVEGDGDAAELPLLAHLLIPTHHRIAQPLEQGPRLVRVLDDDLELLAHLDVPLDVHGPLEGQARPPGVGAQAEDLSPRQQLAAAVQDPVVLEGRRADPPRLQLDEAVAQLVELHAGKLDLAFQVVLTPHSSLRRSSSRATERMPL